MWIRELFSYDRFPILTCLYKLSGTSVLAIHVLNVVLAALLAAGIAAITAAAQAGEGPPAAAHAPVKIL
jgi:hypothetical protein